MGRHRPEQRIRTAPALKDARVTHFINQLKQKYNGTESTSYCAKQRHPIYLFCTGFPAIEEVHGTIKVTEKGINAQLKSAFPFSITMADGPVIQHAATRALKNGMTLKLLFD